MAKKTFKIGECCKGGIITVETKKDLITVTNSGTPKHFDSTDNACRRELNEHIGNLTTSYYTDKVIKWIDSVIKIGGSKFFWANDRSYGG